MRYTCFGPVRGACGVRHRSLDTAIACLRRDRQGCVYHGGYSDRVICHVDGSALDDNEQESVELALDEMRFR
jgi:hypothetical protein